MILLSVLVFAIAILGYIIENGIVDLTWQMIGLDIKWEPVYSYAAIGLGIIFDIILFSIIYFSGCNGYH